MVEGFVADCDRGMLSILCVVCSYDHGFVGHLVQRLAFSAFVADVGNHQLIDRSSLRFVC